MKRTMLLAAYDAVESLASLSSRVESRFRSDKKRTLKSAPVVGHNGFRYRVHSDWGIPDEPSRYPVKDCHEMVVDSLGRIVLLTNRMLIIPISNKKKIINPVKRSKSGSEKAC